MTTTRGFETLKMPNTTKLTPKLIRNLLPEQDSQQIERLDLSGRGISEVRVALFTLRRYQSHSQHNFVMPGAHQVGNLGSCPRLIRLDLSNNSIKDTAWAASCTQLKWLSLASNPVTSLAPLQCLSHLQVLNAGHAQLAGDVDVSGLTSLGALIVNDNQITSLSGALPLTSQTWGHIRGAICMQYVEFLLHACRLL